MALWSGILLAFAGTALVARGLGKQDYGSVLLAMAGVSLLATFLDLTLEEAVVHHGFRALAAGDLAGLAQLLRAALVVDVVIGLGVSATIALLAGPLASLISDGRLDPSLVRLAVLGTVAATADGTTGAVIMLAGRPDLRAWTVALTSGARLVFVVAALRVGGPGAVLIAFALAAAVGAGTQALVSWKVGWRNWRDRGGPRLTTSVAQLVRFGAHTSATTTVVALRTALVSVVLGRTAGAATVGTFNVAMLPVVVGSVVSAPLRLVLLAEQARLSAAGATTTLRRLVRKYTVMSLAVGVPAAVAGWYLLPWLVPALYSHQFVDAVAPARVLLVMAVVQLALGWSKTLPGAVGRPQVRTVVSLIDLAVTTALVLALAHRGAQGAAIALSCSSVLLAVVWLAAGRALLRTPNGNADRGS